MAQLIDVSTRKHPNTFAVVDDEDYERITVGPRWYCYASKQAPHLRYARRLNNGRAELLHRVVLNATAGSVVDHRDGDGLNNRRANLRECDQRGNCRNRKIVGASGFKGVHQTPTGKWIARITLNRSRSKINLGTFESPLDAAAAYDEKAVELFGEFARTNATLGLMEGA